MSQPHLDLSPFQFQVFCQMTWRFVPISPILSRLNLTFGADEIGEGICPLIKLCKDIRLSRHVLRLIVAVLLAVSELEITPERIRDFNSAVTTLPDQRRISVAHLFERLFLRIEILLVPKNLRASPVVQLVG